MRAFNRKERRRQIATGRERNAKLQEFDANCRLFPGGPFSARCTLIRMETLPALGLAALAGDRVAESAFMQIRELISQYDRYRTGDPTSHLCLSCSMQMGSKTVGAIALATSLRGNFSLGIGICEPCSRNDDRVIIDAFIVRASMIWPQIHISGTGGGEQ